MGKTFINDDDYDDDYDDAEFHDAADHKRKKKEKIQANLEREKRRQKKYAEGDDKSF
ncbi:hypothetical protein K6Y31_09850 [Motilimonas cestriensis]|uniref:Uncharacterized protein n=1 Tax=Motilimonas cestriensis TaxID=2742685 RepID=A0ABS8WBZ6_9GAMM|nr:hypothetical protein [Motilimonas cestriensis]MCE2595121.1 hypothetical protein [Motilimonas cestriensis]